MGFFSWKTADTGAPINNRFSDNPSGSVYLLQPGSLDNIKEDAYEGYGMFGGVDAYAWLARMNIKGIDKTLSDDSLRGYGIDLSFSGKELIFPLKFSFNKNAIYEKLNPSETDENQGFF